MICTRMCWIGAGFGGLGLDRVLKAPAKELQISLAEELTFGALPRSKYFRCLIATDSGDRIQLVNPYAFAKESTRLLKYRFWA
jgi:hypothetical protein